MSTSLLQKIGFSQPSIRHHFTWFLLVSLTLTLPLLAQVKKFNKEDYFSKSTLTAGKGIHRIFHSTGTQVKSLLDTATAGNGIYRISLEKNLGEGIGLYTVGTGPRHPITRNNNNKMQGLLAGGTSGEHGRPGTSYLTIRSYTSTTDYVQSEFPARSDTTPYGIFDVVWLDSTFINDDSLVTEDKYLIPIKKIFFSEDGARDTLTTGYIVTYKLPGLLNPRYVRDRMVISEKIEVHGTDFGDSWVEITAIVRNTGPEAIEIGIRYLWDLTIGNDEGPVLTESAFNTSFGNNEASFDWINFAFFRAEANDVIRATRLPDYHVYGSALTPTNLLRVPLQPTRLQQVSWSLAFFKAFDYTIDNSLDITTPRDPKAGLFGGDKAMQLFWGEKLDNAITIKPGDSVQVTQALFASPSDGKPTLYDLALPTCEVTKTQFEPVKRFELAIQDEISGLRRVQAENLFNAKIEVSDFKTGATEPVPIIVTAIDEAKPVRIIVQAVDLSGNLIECSPTFQMFKPGLNASEYHLTPLFRDRYFYIKNQGVRRFVANLNGNEFVLSAENQATHKTSKTIFIPLNGEITIDLRRYLKEGGNTLHFACEGPEESHADLVLSDMKMKNGVDFELNLSPLPQQFVLHPNWPNPFRNGTTIQFQVPASLANLNGTEKVEIKIYNLLGQHVRTLVDADLQPGYYNVQWNGRDENGRPVAAGVFLYNLTAGKIRMTKKMALLR